MRATWTQTRKANCDILQSRVENTIEKWQSGKFMEVNMRGWSINSYCLSKIWFRMKSVDLRVCDIKKITSCVKSWLFVDMLFKPEESTIYRSALQGRLGAHNVENKALAGLIRSFMETACNAQFRQLLFHNMLFRHHVLGDMSIDPGHPPFYFELFFNVIRKVQEQLPLNVITMSENNGTKCY